MSKITKVSENFIHHIEKFECGGDVTKYLKPYKCPAGVPTIGYGNTFYENGSKVKLTDPLITKEKAQSILRASMDYFEKQVDALVVDSINQNQFDALVDFAYNVGIGNLKSSTLLKKVNKNPNDPTIREEFMKWVFAGGKKLNGLVKRRESEADLYFKK
jgi:lysozyme